MARSWKTRLQRPSFATLVHRYPSWLVYLSKSLSSISSSWLYTNCIRFQPNVWFLESNSSFNLLALSPMISYDFFTKCPVFAKSLPQPGDLQQPCFALDQFGGELLQGPQPAIRFRPENPMKLREMSPSHTCKWGPPVMLVGL